jgi:hypothetical protein
MSCVQTTPYGYNAAKPNKANGDVFRAAAIFAMFKGFRPHIASGGRI